MSEAQGASSFFLFGALDDQVVTVVNYWISLVAKARQTKPPKSYP